MNITKTALILKIAISAFARDHIALNGAWTLIPDKSDFAGQPVMKTGTVTINEREGDITVSRDFTYEGSSGTVFYRDMTDSRNSATIRDGKDFKSKAKWDHDALKVTTTQSGAATVETYSIAPDGNLVVDVVKPDGKNFRLVFQRK